jgi:hypothetical protein
MASDNRLHTLVRSPAILLLPTLPRCLLANHQAAREWTGDDFLRFRDEWAQVLAEGESRKWDAIAILYQDTIARLGSFESKGVGILQAIAIVAAGAFVALTGTAVSVTLGALGLMYLIAAGFACCYILLPRMRYQLTLDDLTGNKNGYAEMAASIKTMVPAGIRSSNLVRSAIEDLMRASVLTLAAIVALIWIGHPSIGNGSPVPSPSPSMSSARASSPSIKPSPTARSQSTHYPVPSAK